MTAEPMYGTTTLVVDVPKGLWLSSNRPVTNHGHKARIKRDIHELVRKYAARQHLVAFTGPVYIDWTIRYPKGVRVDKGDSPNAHPTTKIILDALVTAGFLEDDGPLHVTSETYRRGVNLDVTGIHQIVAVIVRQEVPFA